MTRQSGSVHNLLVRERAGQTRRSALLSRAPLCLPCCLPDTHNSTASVTHDGGLARSSALPSPLLALAATDQTRFALISRKGGHLIETPCVNRRSLLSRPALGGIAGETLHTLELLKTHRWATNSQAIEALVLRHVLRGPCRSFARCVKQQQQQYRYPYGIYPVSRRVLGV